MNKLNPNAPAFPNLFEYGERWGNDAVQESGLSIRAELAARAMQALLTADVDSKHGPAEIRSVVKSSLAYADALINELNK